MQTSLRGIADKVALHKEHRFRNLFEILDTGYMMWSWQFVNKNASPGVDRVNAWQYGRELEKNIIALVKSVKEKWYRAKLVLRKYIPKLNGKMRPLGIPATADKLLQTGVAKILEAIYEQDFLTCSYGYRPKRGAHDAVRELTKELKKQGHCYIVEADIKGYFDNIDHEILMEMLEKRIDDKSFLGLIRKWLKAGILNTDGKILHPVTGTPQGGTVSPILANVYLHYALDEWFEEVVKAHCKGSAYLSRYADDFVCVFQYETDAERFYKVLGKRLEKYGLELAEDKTNLMRFSYSNEGNNASFEFLGFEFRYGVNGYGRPIIKLRTSRKKYKASLEKFKEWCKESYHLHKKELFAKLNAKLRGYYNYYGISGNFESLGDFFYQAQNILFKWLNRRSQRKSYTWEGFRDLLKEYNIAKPRICVTI